MNSEKLLSSLQCEKINLDKSVEVSGISIDSRTVERGDIFFCIKGESFDGHNFTKMAQQKGACMIVCERLTNCDLPHVLVKNVRQALNKISKIFYGDPDKKLKIIGVVGTNGKTTTCNLIYKTLNENNVSCGMIGTLGAVYANKVIQTNMTTPDSHLLYKILNDMVNEGITTVVMEYSAHAIYYKKIDFKFDFLIFTNCTHDHLDFFGDFESYKRIKQSPFIGNRAKVMIVNSDDKVGELIINSNKGRMISYGIINPCDVFALQIKQGLDKTNFVMNLFDSIYDMNISMMGLYNVYNYLACATVCALLGVKTDKIAKTLNMQIKVEGRMEKVSNKINAYIDYAHTPDGLKNALQTLNSIKGKARLICVFGCGGNRDNDKRSVMGEISGLNADFTVITSDNPRFEDAENITKQIENGTRRVTNEYITITDRYKALSYAVNIAKMGDYLLVAGKGCEKYQEVMGVFNHFNDKQYVTELIEKKYDLY